MFNTKFAFNRKEKNLPSLLLSDGLDLKYVSVTSAGGDCAAALADSEPELHLKIKVKLGGITRVLIKFTLWLLPFDLWFEKEPCSAPCNWLLVLLCLKLIVRRRGRRCRS